MIVISHSWEFTPKGNSQFNYLTNGTTTSNGTIQPATTTTTSNNNISLPTNVFNKPKQIVVPNTPSEQQSIAQKAAQTSTSKPQFYLQKSHLNRVFSSSQPQIKKLNDNENSSSANNNSSLSEVSFAYYHKSPLVSNKITLEPANEKWHLKQVNEYCENEIYIRDGRVIVSYGSDTDSKNVKRTFHFDSTVLDDVLCIFEQQKMHSYFPNGSDFHIQLPFKIKNIWKLRDGVLVEKQQTADSCLSNNTNLNRLATNTNGNQMSQILFTLSNPYDDIKPILCKNSNDNKGFYLRENSKQVIVDVIESLNLVLVFSVLNNVHYVYRISDYITEDCQYVNNLLNGTIIQEQTHLLASNAHNTTANCFPGTPLPRAPESSSSCLSMSFNASRKRLSVSPIISTVSFYNKFSNNNNNLNSPLVTNAHTTSSAATSSTHLTVQNSGQTIVSAHQHIFQRNFSPMAALSRSPSCSSSPAVMNTLKRNLNSNLTSSMAVLSAQNRSNLTINNNSNSNPNATFMTPLFEVNNQQTYKTPHNFNNAQNTPNYRRFFTPQLGSNATLNMNEFEPTLETIYEHVLPEYCMELLWTEPVVVAGDCSFNERATKFFFISDLYNQKFICYLMSNKSQLRCLKLDLQQHSEMDFISATPVGTLNYIPARDAVFIESRNLMVVLDPNSALFVYSGMNKLCKLQLNNILWSSGLTNQFGMSTGPAFNILPLSKKGFELQSPIVTPIKSKLFSNNNIINQSGVEMLPQQQQHQQHDESTNQQLFKTPKQCSTENILIDPKSKSANAMSTGLTSSVSKPSFPSTNLLSQQNEFKTLADSTGSRFSIKLNDNRYIRCSLSEITTCKLVSMCLEALKYTLNKDIYYEIIQQWYIHRFSISNSGSESFTTTKNQFNLFLCILLNLCGCFDMGKLEQDLPFLSINSSGSLAKQKSSEKKTHFEDIIEESNSSEYSDTPCNFNKRVKSNLATQQQQASDQDWEFLLSDDFFCKFVESEKNLNEFSSIKSKTKKASLVSNANLNEYKVNKPLVSEHTQQNENLKITGTQFLRQKRPINLLNSPSTGSNNTQSTNVALSGGGILFPYLKNILYTLHLVYEECKLYRSLSTSYSEQFIQILYLLANELNLSLYMCYYEQEFPLLLKLKSQKVFEIKNRINFSSSSSSLPKNSPLSLLITQEPPVLSNFLLKLISNNPLNDKSIINPFPIINSVSKKTIKAIKIYSIIALCSLNNAEKSLSVNYEEFLNQLFLKINFSGFNQSLPTQNLNQSQFLSDPNASFTQVYSSFTLKFNFKPGNENMHENIFSLCLEMGICTLNEIYDYPFSVFLPILEAINWSRENPCFSWPSYAFDLIGRNDLAILKSNSDALTAELQQQLQQQQLNQQLNEHETTSGNDNELEMKVANIFKQQQVLQTNKFNQNQGSNILTFGRKNASNSTNNSLELTIVQNGKKEDEDGMQHMLELDTLKCRFNEDLRINEIRTCLQTTRPVVIKLAQGPDVSDHEFIEEEEKFLAFIVQRTMALPVARGIFTLHTINPIPTEPVIVPELNLKGKSLSKKTTIDLSRIEVPTNMAYWPLFHNGVAAGLTISPQARDLSNAWIKAHLAKNFELTNEQAGFLYGLGLTGHLANFSMLNVHDALTRRHDLTNIAILLGLAASKLGSMDLNVTRLVSMHIRAMMPPVEIELEIPYNIQIAALLSLGLVYVKSANKHISYVLLKEIGRLPGNELEKDLNSLDREAYSLTAGLSLGLILLEKGKKSLTIMDSTFTDELYHYMVGGHKESNSASGYATNSNNNGQSSAAAPSSTANMQATDQANASQFRTNANNNNSYIREGESINTNVTCPGATLALGLIYFNSCDRLIGEWFAPPDSAYLLDSIRPDFLLLRTLARNLIMWKLILPTQKWIINQLSSILKTCIKNDRVLSEKFSDLIQENVDSNNANNVKIEKRANTEKLVKVSFVQQEVKYLNDEEILDISSSSSDSETENSSSFSDDSDDDNNVVIRSKKKRKVRPAAHLLGDLIEFNDVINDNDFEMGQSTKPCSSKKKLDDDFEELADDVDDQTEDEEDEDESNANNDNNLIDDETKLEAFRHIIAGACMSIGLKFAGTFNNEAYQTLLFWAKYFTDLNDTRLSTENCLCVIVLSLSMVMSGSGDLEVLRICRYLKSRLGANMTHVTYGSQMAVNMAMSLLFMGGGRYSLKTDSLSVALMLCAFYPHFPVDSNDNRFHLQAFRHLYVLASEPRLLLSKDVDTNEHCYVPVEITLKANEHHGLFKYQQMAPCILPELNRIQELKILGPRYYPIAFKQNLHFNELKNILLSELLVKQKNGYFSYSDDPKDEKAFNIRNFLNKIIIPHKITPELLEQITNEEHINLFAKMLSKSSNENKLDANINRLLKLVYESVVQETFDFVGIMLLLDKESNGEELSSQLIQQIKLLDIYYKSINCITKKQILSQDVMHYLKNSLESKLNQKIRRKYELIKAYLSDSFVEDLDDLIHFCVLNDISKPELEFFTTCEKFGDLFRTNKSQHVLHVEKLLKLYQLFKN